MPPSRSRPPAVPSSPEMRWGRAARFQWRPARQRRRSPLLARSGGVRLTEEEALPERGSGMKALSGSPPMRSSPSLPTWLPCNEDPPYCTNANNGDRYWHFGGKLHIRLPGRRSGSLFPASRATHGSESGRLGWGNQAPATSSCGIRGFPSHSSIGRWRTDDRVPSMRVERTDSLREPR